MANWRFKFKSILFVFIGLYLIISQVMVNRIVDIKITDSSGVESVISLPHKDKKRLEYLFRDFIVYDAAGYTFFGSKPMSINYVLKPTFKWDFLFLLDAFNPSNLKKYKAWRTWQKHQSLFCAKNFAIWSEPSPRNADVEFIIIANRYYFNRIVSEHIEDFRNVLGKDLLTGDDLLREAVKKPLLKEVLHSHDGLIGTLLGYGRDNSWAFWKQGEENSVRTGAFAKENEALFQDTNASLNISFGWPRVTMSRVLTYPAFMADPETEETKFLKKEYVKTRKKILDYYKAQDFLEGTLRQLFYGRKEGSFPISHTSVD